MRASVARAAAVGLVIGATGCGGGGADSPPEQGGAAPAAHTGDTPTGAHGGGAAERAGNATGRETTSRQPDRLAGSIDVSFISEEFIGAVVAHPHRVLDSKLYREIGEWPGMGLDEFPVLPGIDPREVDQVVWLFDTTSAVQMPFLAEPGFEDDPAVMEPADSFELPEGESFHREDELDAADPLSQDPEFAPPAIKNPGGETPTDDDGAVLDDSEAALDEDANSLVEVALDEPLDAEEDEPDFDAIAAEVRQQRENLRLIGVAWHNYHTKHGELPGAGGGADDSGRGLSWRVHLLPFLNEEDLYQEFKLDEPWDSAHNRQLIERMPDVFAGRGNPESGKTTYQVFVGEGLPFGEGQRPRLDDFVDGTSNTLLVVETGADIAIEWTKPDGLELNRRDPTSELGAIHPFGNLVLFADGRVELLDISISAQLFTSLATHAGGEEIDREYLAEYIISQADIESVDMDEDWGPPPTPTVIVRFRQDIDPEKLIADVWGETAYGIDEDGNEVPPIQAAPDKEVREHAGRRYQFLMTGWGVAVHFPDRRTLVVASEDRLKTMLTAQNVDTPLVNQLRRSDSDADLIAVLDLSTSRDAVVQASQMMADSIPPMFSGLANLAAQVKLVRLTADVTSRSEPLLTLAVQTDDPQVAGQLSQVANQLLHAGREAYREWRQAEGGGQTRRAAEPVLPLVDESVANLVAETKGEQFVLSVPKPQDFERLPELLKPLFEQAQRGRDRARTQSRLINIGLGMWNYRDVYDHYPYADRSSRPNDPNRGLGWRVHLAPYVDGGSAYEAANLEEPWDSEQNLQLLQQMPYMYSIHGGDEGKTSFHVFVGEGAPFGGEQPLRPDDITDGESQTILAVHAGPETAVEWTRPGGLEFDPDNPKESLGNIPDDGLPVVFFDGSVRFLRSDIPDELLKALITPNGNEVIDPEQLEQFTLEKSRDFIGIVE